MIHTKKNKDINNYLKIARKKILAVLAIIMLLMQYMIVPTYATVAEGEFSTDECPYDIKFTKVECGNRNSIALDTEGNLWAWGVNNGQLLDASNGTLAPKQIAKGKKFRDICLGLQSSAVAIGTDGNIYVWSDDGTGSFRYGEIKQITTNKDFVQVVATDIGRYICGVRLWWIYIYMGEEY